MGILYSLALADIEVRAGNREYKVHSKELHEEIDFPFRSFIAS